MRSRKKIIDIFYPQSSLRKESFFCLFWGRLRFSDAMFMISEVMLNFTCEKLMFLVRFVTWKDILWFDYVKLISILVLKRNRFISFFYNVLWDIFHCHENDEEKCCFNINPSNGNLDKLMFFSSLRCCKIWESFNQKLFPFYSRLINDHHEEIKAEENGKHKSGK